jgi:deoxyuridine 5'-triphosphate nucleotidohydrolase|nr:MAG TPA: dUTPase [Caudoviricetes sp.]
MNTKKMRIVLDDGAYMPVRGYKTDAGLDIKTPKDVTVPAKGSVIVDTGVHIELPPNTVGMLKSKSGLNVKYGITSEGVIDVGYTGSIVAKLYNHSETHVILKKGNKITQLVIIPIVPVELEQVSELMATERGSGGFGSTGR